MMHGCRYERVDRKRASRVWSDAFEAAAQKRSGLGVRVRTLFLVSGLVLPVWQEVKRVLAAQTRPIDRRLHVIRLETTGEKLFAWCCSLVRNYKLQDLQVCYWSFDLGCTHAHINAASQASAGLVHPFLHSKVLCLL